MNRRLAIQNVALLLGGTLSAPTLLAMNRLGNIIQDPLNPLAEFTLTTQQKQLVAEVAEMILPKTTTPGAKDAGVPAFIEMMLKDCYHAPEQTTFLEGLKVLEQQNFIAKNTTDRTFVLKKLETDSKAIKDGTPFWKLMKELTLLGYYTSEVGIKASFDYEPIPGKLEVIKVTPQQKSIVY